MELSNTLKFAILVFLLGVLGFYFFKGVDHALWFGVGGTLSLLNLAFAAWVVKNSFRSPANKTLFVGILLIKSFSFLLVLAGVLMFLKPLVLPFSLGVGVLIAGALLMAIFDIRRYLKRNPSPGSSY